MNYILAHDLGTGGNKASIYDQNGHCLAGIFKAYDTLYPQQGWHEQRPMDWWEAVVDGTRELLETTDIDRNSIVSCAVSGHSLGIVPLDTSGALVLDAIPIWSDSRPGPEQTEPFFEKVPESEWYLTTGNGFPAPLYSVFKLMWLRDNQPEIFERIETVIGTKDFINYKMTGAVATDHSYASGSGVYNLKAWDYSEKLIDASGLPRFIFPNIVPSTQVLGTLTHDAADELGLPTTVKVVAGGVDNSCMALGAKAFKEGRAYNSQGSSSWIAVSSSTPLLDTDTRPYVFAHVVPGMYASATAIFSAGTSFRWIRDNVCQDLMARAATEDLDVYDLMTAEAAESPAGANGLLFNPSLAGGSSLDDSPAIRGAFLNLDLSHDRKDVIRAGMEGVALGLRVALDALRDLCPIDDDMLVVGGGSKSELWRQIFADVYGMTVVKSTIDQQAAALGAAALAAVGAGLWDNFDRIDEIHVLEGTNSAKSENAEVYESLLKKYKKASHFLSEL